MPKIFNREIPTWMLGAGVALLGYLCYTGFAGDDSPVKPAPKPKAKDKKNGNSLYLPEDSTGPVFPVFTETPKNSFDPLVSKGGGPTSINGMAAAWAGGESGWSYTGYVTLNRSAQGLLENSSTGAGDYVSPGQKWKTSVIKTVTPDELVLMFAGSEHVIKIGEGSERKGGKDVLPAVAPADPSTALQGPIGNNPALGQQGMNGQNNQNGQGPGQIYNGGGPRRGGGRRGRGGFGGGGNGGGGPVAPTAVPDGG